MIWTMENSRDLSQIERREVFMHKAVKGLAEGGLVALAQISLIVTFRFTTGSLFTAHQSTAERSSSPSSSMHATVEG